MMFKIRNKVKKIFAAVTVLAVLLTCASCGNAHPAQHAKREAVKYFEYIKNKDTKKLNSLFSKEVRDTHDLDKEWEEFYAAIDGNIVSYERIRSGGEEVWTDKGRVTYSVVSIGIDNVVTDTGKTYESIGFFQVRVNKKHPECVGINLFSLEISYDKETGHDERVVGENLNYRD